MFFFWTGWANCGRKKRAKFGDLPSLNALFAPFFFSKFFTVNNNLYACSSPKTDCKSCGLCSGKILINTFIWLEAALMMLVLAGFRPGVTGKGVMEPGLTGSGGTRLYPAGKATLEGGILWVFTLQLLS